MSFRKFLMNKVISSVKPKVNTTDLGKAKSKLNKAIQKTKASGAKLKQTQFELKNKMPLTFKSNKGKSIKESDRKKQIIKDNNEVIGKMVKKAFDAGKGE
jgi:hypothetical protein|tara:strand:+ start:343 stop:642 length:300 start_codon:yes stop_codon:yes gene_type:complete